MRQQILNFHGVGSMPEEVNPSEASVWWSKDEFLLILDGIVAIEKSSGIRIALTFDDGNRSDIDIALRALLVRNLTATFFVCAGRIGMANFLDKRDILELLHAGMRIGSHGMNHVDWRRVSDDDLGEEIVDARTVIESICEREINDLAIPFGSYDRRVLRKLKESKWQSVYSSDGGLARTDAWFKPRRTLIQSVHARSNFEQLIYSETLPTRLRRSIVMLAKSLR